jgi:uncharacterized repeat protein (TIGR01451 family)
MIIINRGIWAWRVLAVLGVVVLSALVSALPGTAEAKPTPPQLSIAVDDGHDFAAAGDTLSYRITVTNLGATSVNGLRITQTVPDVAKLVSSDHGGRSAARTVSWQVDLTPGGKATRQTTVAVAKTLPGDLLRLAIVACARTTAKAPPTVCASDSDQLPAGTIADQQDGVPDQPTAAIGAWWPLPGGIVLGGLLLAMVIAVVIILRRHARRPDSQGSGADSENPADLVSSSRR